MRPCAVRSGTSGTGWLAHHKHTPPLLSQPFFAIDLPRTMEGGWLSDVPEEGAGESATIQGSENRREDDSEREKNGEWPVISYTRNKDAS